MQHDNILTVLLYHGVTDSESAGIENNSKKHLPVDEFARQMEYISNHCVLLTMDEVVDLHHNKKPYPRNSVAVTFDDGFRNNLTVATPVLDAFNVPATFYITSGIINTDMMFWVDELEDCINLTDKGSIDVRLEKDTIFPVSSLQQKLDALLTIKAYCKKQAMGEKDRVVAAVKMQTGVTPSVNHSKNYEKLSWEELKEMSRRKHFIIGGHSLYHDILAAITPDERLVRDIEVSIKLLEYNLGQKITHYAYPEGQQHHYNERVIEILRDFGIVCSPSAIHGVNATGQFDLFNLRRVMVGFNGTPFPFELQ
ncbi:MAG TPA: polysaccharide deacetylase family protein [Chryseosolibacter sp.]